MSEPRKSTRNFADEMNVIGSSVQRTILAGRKVGLTKEASCLAALIGVISCIRVDGLNEQSILQEALRAVPHKKQMEAIVGVKEPS